MNIINFNTKSVGSSVKIECIGDWSISKIEYIEKDFLESIPKNSNITLDIKKITNLDSAGATLIILYTLQAKKLNSNTNIISNNQKHKKLLNIIKKSLSDKDIVIKKRTFTESISKNIYIYILAIKEFVAFIGEFFIKSLFLFKRKNFRYKEIFYFIYSSGIKAIPIISLTSFLVGIVIAYQTIVQLAKFGADIFVVDASAISIARELGPMITAIVVAGRSASSFAAELGAMKLTQEIDAMKTMGFKPFYFLIIPRIIAMVISLPILIFISDIIGILGAMVATKAQIALSFEIFLQRLYEVLALKHYLVGILKGPFFAFLIAVIGSFHGLRVTQNTESIGQETTKSVVNAIFLVIVCDALFSVIFTRLGI